jgi:hypothetical protein
MDAEIDKGNLNLTAGNIPELYTRLFLVAVYDLGKHSGIFTQQNPLFD